MSSAVFVVTSLSAERAGVDYLMLEDDIALELHNSESVLLSAVFPWGSDAAFNRFQIPQLVEDIRAVSRNSGDPNMVSVLDGLAAFISKGVNAIGEDIYVLFVAD